jgi:hypothetical protein
MDIVVELRFYKRSFRLNASAYFRDTYEHKLLELNYY